LRRRGAPDVTGDHYILSMEENWSPLGSSPREQDALHEGVPNWMKLRFWEWLDNALEIAASNTESQSTLELVMEFDERKRLAEPLAGRFRSYNLSSVLVGHSDAELPLSVADFLLASAHEADQGLLTRELEAMLHRSGSAWRAGRRLGTAGLERRVSEGVQEAADATMSNSGSAGQILAEAWRAAFGMSPDPEKAYSKAIKAVEEAAKPHVSPKDSVATLGKMISAMRDQKTWGLPLMDDERNPARDTLLNMMRSLHFGQQQRHGGNGERGASQREAETAVFLAVPLVQFFHAGLFDH
jgi:hypothetical protein